MAWIEVHQSLPTHRKTLALADALNIEPVHALGHLTSLWLWTLDNAPDGALRDVSSRTIARAAQWRKDPDALVAALIGAGFLEDDHRVHDWDDYAGRLVEKRAANRQRMKDARASHVQRTNDARAGATVPDRTVPDHIPESTGIPPAASPRPPQGGRRVTEVDDEYVASLVDEFGEVFGSRQACRDVIAEAMSHKARMKRTDQRAYLRNWVRRDAEAAAKRRGRRPPVTVEALEELAERRAFPRCAQCGEEFYVEGEELCIRCFNASTPRQITA